MRPSRWCFPLLLPQLEEQRDETRRSKRTFKLFLKTTKLYENMDPNRGSLLWNGGFCNFHLYRLFHFISIDHTWNRARHRDRSADGQTSFTCCCLTVLLPVVIKLTAVRFLHLNPSRLHPSLFSLTGRDKTNIKMILDLNRSYSNLTWMRFPAHIKKS